VSDHSDPTSPAEESDWIKSLVAEALIKATDEESTTAEMPIDVAEADSSTPSATVSAPTVEHRSLAEPVRVEETVLTPAVPQEIPGAVAVAQRTEPETTRPFDQVLEEEDATTEGFRQSDIRTIVEWLAVIISALVVALVIKAFVLQAFWIPSESMETTVNEGDRILVNKLSYELHDVRRGDLVVFKKLPGTPGPTEDLIKRAIALPGETIEVRDDGHIWIWAAGETPEDAQLLIEPYLDPRNETLQSPSATDSLSTDIWDERCANQRTPGRCTLADGQYFMMGDNRHSSSDSRVFGPVTEDLLVGRAFLRIWPLGDISSL